MFANGLAMPAPSPPPSCAPFGFPAKGLSLGKERPPNPALCKAILVPILFRKDMAAVFAYESAGLIGDCGMIYGCYETEYYGGTGEGARAEAS
jgi:hypothetical protein